MRPNRRGESLTLYLTAVSVGGITLVIIPLLSLTANQLERIKTAMQEHGAVVATHLDDAGKNDVKENVIPKMDAFPCDVSTTFMILCSPQYIAENVDFRNALLRARDRKVLRLVAIDEVHIYAMHGRSFRDSIRVLKRDFFAKLYRDRIGYSPLFLVMTATMPTSLIATLEDLTYVPWSKPCHQMRSSAKQFRQRYIDMDLRVQGDIQKLGLAELVLLLKESDDTHACVFVNFKSECAKWAAVLEGKIADNLLNVDVVQINGDQDKHEKFAYTKLFTTSVTMKDYSPRVLMATAAANTGIDQALVKWVLTVGLPRCLTTLMQERGRNRAEGLYLILTDWKLFIKLLLSTVTPYNTNSSGDQQEHDYINSMIMSRSPEKRNNEIGESPATLAPVAPLNLSQKRAVTVQAYEDIIDVVNFLFLPGLGCIHLRAEWYLATGANTPLPDNWPNEEYPVCGDKCYVCRGNYVSDLLPIVYEGAVEFLQSEYFSGVNFMPYSVTHEEPESVTDRLWNSGDYKKKIFGKKSVTKYNVNAFFFQLVATGILTFEWNNTETKVVCTLGTDDNEIFKYKNTIFWKGFNFRTAKRDGASVSYSHIFNKN